MDSPLKVGKCYKTNINWGLLLDAELDKHTKVYLPATEIFLLLSQDTEFEFIGELVTQIKILYKEKIYFTFLRDFEFEHFTEL